MFRLRSCASSTISVSYCDSSGSDIVSASRIPSVINLIVAPGDSVSSKRILWPTCTPGGEPSSSAMRRATVVAARRRGWVWPISPARPPPAIAQIFGSCVVLPEPVSPLTMTTGWRRIASAISSRRADTGSASGNRRGGNGRRGVAVRDTVRCREDMGRNYNDAMNAPTQPVPLAATGLAEPAQPVPPAPSATSEDEARFVAWLRQVAPYIHAFRGRTFVVAVPGELIQAGWLNPLVQDLSL